MLEDHGAVDMVVFGNRVGQALADIVPVCDSTGAVHMDLEGGAAVLGGVVVVGDVETSLHPGDIFVLADGRQELGRQGSERRSAKPPEGSATAGEMTVILQSSSSGAVLATKSRPSATVAFCTARMQSTQTPHRRLGKPPF